ncbi:hypothetical protein EYC84_010268 [Monilinia fructicola]|uniref:Uncharacterized protein n=1 Tax=Monilinia fructicola TaxID=38448 RepID=A0A5M9JHM2_MONFR|nr:hypothetical protein EYC84_010268 [Monilinia fructicola]
MQCKPSSESFAVAISNMLKEPKRKAESLKPAPLVLKANPSRFRVSALNGPKLPSHKLDLKIPPLGSIAQSKQDPLPSSLRPTPNLAHRPVTIPNTTIVTPHPAPITPHPAAVTPHPTTVAPHPAAVALHPATVAPHPAATHSCSPQRKIATAHLIEHPCKVHPIGSPTRPPILSQPRSLFYTGNLPVPIHAKNVLEQPNPWVDEQNCRSASSTQSMLVSADSRHEKIHDGCMAGSSKTEGNVQNKVGKLDKGLSKGLPRGAMFIQLPKQTNSSVEKEKCDEVAVSTAQNITVASELTPLLGLKDSPILASPRSTGPWKESKDSTKDQKRKREESLKKKAEKKLKRQGLGAVIAAGDEEETGSCSTAATDVATATQLAADSLYPQRNRRHDSKSEPRGFSVSFDFGWRSNGGSEENTSTLVKSSQAGEASRVGIAKVGERKGILKNFAQEKRRVSAPARESVGHDGQKRRERIPTPMAMVGGLVGPGLAGLGVGVPTVPEMERGLTGPPVSMNMQAAPAENGMSGGRKMYMGGGLMRGKRRQWKIRSRAAGSTSAQGNGSLNDGGNMGMDGAGGSQGGNEVGERSAIGKGKGKGRGSVRFADEA